MRIFYKPQAFLLLMAITAFFGSITSRAQQVQFGTFSNPAPVITSGFPNPFPHGNSAMRSQYLYLASELKAKGMVPGKITRLWFYVGGFGSKIHDNYRVYAGTTSATSIPTNAFLAQPTQVYGPTALQPNYLAWTPINFSTPVDWDGTTNVLIEVCYELSATTRTSNATAYNHAAGFNASRSSASTTATVGCGSNSLTVQGTTTDRPHTRFDYVPNCIVPDSINITGITANAADVNWPHSSTYNINSGAFVRAYNWVHWEKGTNMPSGYNGVVPTKTSHKLVPLKPETCYYVRLQTDCKWTGAGTDTSDWILDSFCTLVDCVPPVTTVDRVTSTTAVGSWPPVPTAYDYEYAVTVLDNAPTAGMHTTSTAVQLVGLSPEKWYWLFVRAYCAQTAMSRWSKFQFNTLKGLGFDDISTGFAISAYPNPVKDEMQIHVVNPGDNGALTITDLTGKLVYSGSVYGGRLHIDMSSFTAGIYLVKYTDNLHSKMIKITKE